MQPLRYHSTTVLTTLRLTITVAIMSIAVTGCATAETDGVPPNIIIILADDLGYADVGCYWQPNDMPGCEKIETPNIDRMASEGIRFTDFYVGSAVCSPSRAALMTGCYPPRVGFSDPDETTVKNLKSKTGLNPNETTIAEALKTKGYATACIGKWHLGHQSEFMPTRHGFDTYYGLMFRSKKGNKLMRDDQVIDTVGDDVLTSLYTEEAIRFMTENRDKPFFVYLSHSMPHVPLGVTEPFAGVSKRGLYGDVVAELDDSTGRILAALEELGLDERTLVIFMSDNGPALRYEADGGKAYPLRDGKGWVWEGGFRVPFIARWPGRIAPGVESSEIATAMDLLPTVCALADVELETNGPIDGRDIWPLLTDRTATSPHEAFYYYHAGRLHGIRMGKWKLRLINDNVEHQAIVDAEPMALFDLSQDPGEVKSVLGDHPDVAARLNRFADDVRRQLGDPISGWPGTERRPAGSVE